MHLILELLQLVLEKLKVEMVEEIMEQEEIILRMMMVHMVKGDLNLEEVHLLGLVH